MTTCGIWPRPHGLVALLVDHAGHTRSVTIAPTDDARWGLSQRLAATGTDLVVDAALLEADAVAPIALRAGVTVWVAGAPLVEALRSAAGVVHRAPRLSAALLARLPAIPWLRLQLRRLDTIEDDRQIKLL